MVNGPQHRQGQVEAFGLRAGRLGTVLSLTLGGTFALLLLSVALRWHPLLQVDDSVRDDLHRYALPHPAFVTFMKALSTAGSGPVYAAIFLTLIAWLALRRMWRLTLYVVFAMVGSSLLNAGVKSAVGRARPQLANPVAYESGAGFPSGHAQTAMVSYAVLFIVFLPLLRGRWRWLAAAACAAMVLGIGFSRVALGVHYGSDVLSGYLLGAAWVAALTVGFRVRGREGATGDLA